MSTVEQLERQIESLPEPDYNRLRKWFSRKDWEKWDQEIEADSRAGKLEFLVREARGAKAHGKLKDL